MDIHTVSILGSSLFDPIAILVKRLIEENKSNSYLVGGLSASICLLSIVSLESYIMRARYINNASGNDLDKLPTYKYIKKIFPEFQLENEMIEIFILRDVLTHNHLWESLYDNTTGESVTERLSSGDQKYRNNVDTENSKTKILSLNVDPTKVTYNDAKLVLATVWSILCFLEEKNRELCYVSDNTYVDYDGNQILFSEVIEKII